MNLFKTHQQHGIILLDEMSVRISLLVNSKILTYFGPIDFREDVTLVKVKN